MAVSAQAHEPITNKGLIHLTAVTACDQLSKNGEEEEKGTLFAPHHITPHHTTPHHAAPGLY
jgi:hypothetical protein